MKKKTVHSIVIMMMSLLMGMNTGMQVRASGTVDLSHPGSISIVLRDEFDKRPLGGTFTLFKVAAVSEKGTGLSYTFTEEFKDSGVNLEDLSAEGLAEHLVAYVRDPYRGIQGITRTADSQGEILFTDLQVAVYLVVQEGKIPGYYPAKPFVISVPITDSSGKGWQYDVDAIPKTRIITGSGLTNISVRKRWQDDASARPRAITVSLLCDYNIYDTVALTERDQWSHKWDALDGKCVWTVVEKDVPANYTVSYERPEEKTIIMTNTQDGPSPVTDTPPTDDPQPTVITTTTTTTTYTSAPSAVENRVVIQTGQLRWPVPLLACTGMVLFLYGWRKVALRGHRESED